MRRYILTLVLCVATITHSMAQDENNKNYLPEKGDISIGIDFTPVFKYLGNLFNSSTSNTLDGLGGAPITDNVDGFNIDNIAPDVSIMAKYMLTDHWAVRANVGMMLRTNTTRAYVVDDMAHANDPLSESKLIDSRRVSRNGMSVMLGGEYRRGNKRIQGVFGAGLIFGFNQSKTTYQYANALTDINHKPTIAWNTYTDDYRTLQSKTASNLFLGVTGSVGVEWFVAPKVALGAEVNLALYYVKGGQQYVTSEGYNTVLDAVETRYDVESPGDNAFRFGTDNLGGSLYMSFYF